MNGSWHRYRPGERWRRPPARARLVLEVPGAVAVCFDAPVVELFEQRAEALHPVARAARAGPARARLRRRRGRPPPARPVARRHRRSRDALLDQRALAGIGNVYKNEVLWIERVSPFATVADLDDDDARPARRDRPAPARRQRRGRATARSGSRRPAIAAPRGRSTSTAGPADRADAAAPRSPAPARDATLPRTTYWCPTCQGAKR